MIFQRLEIRMPKNVKRFLSKLRLDLLFSAWIPRDSKMLRFFEDTRDDVIAEFPNAKTYIITSHSGGIILEVYLGENLLCLQYSESLGVGVVVNPDPFTENVDKIWSDGPPTVAYLKEQLRNGPRKQICPKVD